MGDTRDRFEVVRELGRGAMGSVLEARDHTLGRTVALKVLLGANATRRKRFEAEAQALARLRHPNVVGLHEVVTHEGRACLVMELVKGQDLDGLLAGGPLDPRRAAELAAGVADALGAAHALGVLHRDVKPGNVLVDENGQAKLTDFGLAKDLKEIERLTLTGQVVGTPAYMAPEQARSGTLDARTDVYGLGATLYTLLTDRPPFPAGSISELIGAILSAIPEPPSSIVSTVSRDLDAICLRCLEKDPDDRYASAAELAEDLRRYLAGDPVVARSGSSILQGHLRAAKRRWPLALALGVAVSSLAAALLVSPRAKDPAQPPPPTDTRDPEPTVAPTEPTAPLQPLQPLQPRTRGRGPTLLLSHDGVRGARFVNGSRLRALSWNTLGLIRVWDLTDGRLVEERQFRPPTEGVALGRDRFAVACRTRYRVDLFERGGQRPSDRGQIGATRVGWSADGETLFVGGQFNMLLFCSAPKWRAHATLSLEHQVQGMSASPDGKWLVVLVNESSSELTHQAHLVDLRTRTIARTWEFMSRPTGVAFAPDSQRFAVGQSSGYLEILTVTEATPRSLAHTDTGFREAAHPVRLSDVAFSKDRVFSVTNEPVARLSAETWTNALRVWDADSGECLQTALTTRTTRYHTVDVSSDGDWLLVASEGADEVSLWPVDGLR